jgi:ankyrin repeat protein
MGGMRPPPPVEVSVLHAAEECEYEDLKRALKRGGDPNRRELGGVTPLMIVAQDRRNDLVQMLLLAGAEPSLQDDGGSTALHRATNRDALPCVQLLVEAGAQVNTQDNAGETALHRAAEFGWVECAEFLVASGANVNLKDSQGENSLCYARDWHEWQSDDMKARKKAVGDMLEENGAARPHSHPLPPIR